MLSYGVSCLGAPLAKSVGLLETLGYDQEEYA
jgi:hypothetical protein